MNEKLKHFYEQQNTPWMQLFYQMIWTQLPQISGKKVLDFGSGFGWTANHLAAADNDVLAIEPNAEMVENRLREHDYQQLCGGLDDLKKLPAASFDLIICHNVLEYADERAEIMAEFNRLVSADGLISIVKHNHAGRIFQKVVFENALDEAYAIETGQANPSAVSFGQVHYYDLSELTKNLSVSADKTFGVRTFFGMQPNAFKTEPDWQAKMYKIEMEVAEKPEYNSVSFFHHILLTKK